MQYCDPNVKGAGRLTCQEVLVVDHHLAVAGAGALASRDFDGVGLGPGSIETSRLDCRQVERSVMNTARPQDQRRRHGNVEVLTDTGLHLLATALKDDIWILLADKVVVLQELATDAADGVTVTAGGHGCV